MQVHLHETLMAEVEVGHGVLVAISSDARHIQDFANLYYGVGQARRGWLEKKDVLNSASLKALRTLLKQTM